MSFEPVYKAPALEKLDDPRLADVLDCIFSHIRQLADDPHTHGRKSRSPTHPRGQQFEFGCQSQAADFRFTVYYYFTEDEKHIEIHDIVPVQVR